MPRLEAAEAFDAVADQYEAAYAGLVGRQEVTRQLAARLSPGARVADLGCGTGRPVLARLVAAGLDVTGYDVSPRMVELARANVPGARVELADLRTLALEPGSLDAITSFFSLLQMSRAEIGATITACARWLRPGGRFVLGTVPADIEDFDIEFLGQPIAVSSYPAEGYDALLTGAGFEVTDRREETISADAPDAQPEHVLYLSARKS